MRRELVVLLVVLLVVRERLRRLGWKARCGIHGPRMSALPVLVLLRHPTWLLLLLLFEVVPCCFATSGGALHCRPSARLATSAQVGLRARDVCRIHRSVAHEGGVGWCHHRRRGAPRLRPWWRQLLVYRRSRLSWQLLRLHELKLANLQLLLELLLLLKLLKLLVLLALALLPGWRLLLRHHHHATGRSTTSGRRCVHTRVVGNPWADRTAGRRREAPRDASRSRRHHPGTQTRARIHPCVLTLKEPECCTVHRASIQSAATS